MLQFQLKKFCYYSIVNSIFCSFDFRKQNRNLRVKIDDNLKCMLGNKPRSVTVQQSNIDGSNVAFRKGNIPGELVLTC